MARLEDLTPGARVHGLTPEGIATVKSVSWYGNDVAEVVFADVKGHLQQSLLYRADELSLRVAEPTRRWSFDGDGNRLRLVSEAYRIHLAWLFDPYVAISSSMIEPLPHQISAVYEEMLPRQPLRFLLADDPGAGKTIMAGLLIRELMIRGDLERCLIVAPGSLTEQWQDELYEKFGLEFEILSRDMIAAARTANPFDTKSLLIARLDQLSRDEELQAKFQAAQDWDLVVCDEAHRMSGHIAGDEIKYTKRYRLGQTVGSHCRNLLLMTATPHNGKEADFQIFLALLDADRFEGKFRDGVHLADPSDLMRRMVKEDLLKFDGRPLFPERKSYTIKYDLSPLETRLYTEVTDYVREEMNRVERNSDNNGQRRVNVGFALMTLQRRLASSPEAIFRSIQRRRERLESRLREERLLLRGKSAEAMLRDLGPQLKESDWDDLYEEAPQEEREAAEQNVVDYATASRTITELELEITRLKELEQIAREVNAAAEDTKWNQLSRILDDPLMVDDLGHRRKLVLFTEFRDTLDYLVRRIRIRFGKPEAVVEIHGGVPRDDRRTVVHAFMNDPQVLVLVANDAAGEGVNLQRAHLMINYDLPWNPNRLEQRFGRIHRIGQAEVCHLWNIVAKDTREGEVYIRLLEKLEVERDALGGKVFDVLGQLFEQRPLRELLVEAIRYGNDPKVRAKLHRVIDGAVDRTHLSQLLERRALVHDHMDVSRIHVIRESMERAYASRLQPYFIQSFFLQAFAHLGGKIYRREEGRFEIRHVPAEIRQRDRLIGTGAPVLERYERVCFDKAVVDRQPRAHLICPGSPLLDATIDLILEQNQEVLKSGAVLIDEQDPGIQPRLLFYVQHTIRDGRRLRNGKYQVIAERLQFVEVTPDGRLANAGAAPYLDYRAATEEETALLQSELEADWLKQDWERHAMGFAVQTLVPTYLTEVKAHRLPLIDKVEQEVKVRLLKEINYWDHRAEDLKAKERAGKKTRLPASEAQKRAERLADRLEKRLADLKQERAIVSEPPCLHGTALILPAGLLRQFRGEQVTAEDQHAEAEHRKQVELLAMKAVFDAERQFGREPRDRSAEPGLGYDIESRDPITGELFFIEVKGRVVDALDITLTRNEILCAFNVPERFRLAVVLVKDGQPEPPRYITGYDFGQPGFEQSSANYPLKSLLRFGKSPC